jgi:putative NADH-flavin reductase
LTNFGMFLAPPLLLKLYQEYGPKDRLQFVVGDVLNANDVDRAVETSDAVVSCMGAPRAMSIDANDFYEKTGKVIVESMIRNGTKRLIVVTAAQAKRMSKAWWDSNASLAENSARHLYWGGHYKYISELEKYIESHHTHIEYTFLRPSQLHDDSKGETCVAEADTFFIGGSALPRPALAKFIVDCVVNRKYIGQGVALAGPEDS